jgi:hypothetical protein
MSSNVHDMFSVRNMFYEQLLFFCDLPPDRRGAAWNRLKRLKYKTKRPAAKARRKSWEVSPREAGGLYQIYFRNQSPAALADRRTRQASTARQARRICGPNFSIGKSIG